jgi:hypothetical protein
VLLQAKKNILIANKGIMAEIIYKIKPKTLIYFLLLIECYDGGAFFERSKNIEVE